MSSSPSADAETDAVWTLRYWPKMAGRAEFVRIVFEEAGVRYEEDNDAEKLFRLYKTQEARGQEEVEHRAPPVVIRGGFSLSGTPVICRYLGHRFGLCPESEEDQWHAEQVNHTIHDFIAEGRLAFHGLNHNMTYYKQVEETQPYIRTFVETRLGYYLRHFLRVLRRNAPAAAGGKAAGFLFGDSLTYVDLALLHALRATEAQFPTAWARMTAGEGAEFEPLAEYKRRLEERPRLKEYFSSERCKPFEGNSMM